MSAAQKFDIATAHHRQGQLGEAERLYREVIGQDPKHASATFLLSVLAMSSGKLDEAIRLLQQAIALAPDNPAFHSNLGEAYRRLGRNEEAVHALLAALSLKPDLAEPTFNLGLALRALGEDDAAIGCFERAADFKFDSFPVQYAFAVALRLDGQLERSVGHFQCAIALNPKSQTALIDLGNVLQILGRTDGAVALFRRAIEIDPNFVTAHNNLGTAWLEKLELDQAIACFRRALAVDPSLGAAHNNLGNAMKDSGYLDEAIASFRRAIEVAPSDLQAHSNLVYTLSFHPDYDAPAILGEARRWTAKHADHWASTVAIHDNDRSPDRRLRIGYVSPDFRSHCQAHFTLPLFASHDRAALEVFCYSSVQHADAVTEQVRQHVDHWRDVATLGDGAVADRIRQDGIDILVDLTMHMAHGRLGVFARKPAPVQISWLAYPGTTGLATIDYRVTDPYLDPPELDREGNYSERSLRLADTFWCYDALGGPNVNELPASTRGYVTFACLNNFCKVNRAALELWARVLIAVPDSRFLLLAPTGAPRHEAQDILARAGVDVKRLTFVERASRLAYLARYHDIDICLDTFPYNGHTTSLDALWMGVPVVTLVGATVVGRAGLSQAMNLGLPEFVTTTPDEFVACAARMASDLPLLTALRVTLRGRMEKSPLMDAPRFARSLESAYRDAWRRFCDDGAIGIAR